MLLNWGWKDTELGSEKLIYDNLTWRRRHGYFYPAARRFVRKNLGLNKAQSNFFIKRPRAVDHKESSNWIGTSI